MLHLPCLAMPEVDVLRKEGIVEVRTVALLLGANDGRKEGAPRCCCEVQCCYGGLCRCPKASMLQPPCSCRCPEAVAW